MPLHCFGRSKCEAFRARRADHLMLHLRGYLKVHTQFFHFFSWLTFESSSGWPCNVATSKHANSNSSDGMTNLTIPISAQWQTQMNVQLSLNPARKIMSSHLYLHSALNNFTSQLERRRDCLLNLEIGSKQDFKSGQVQSTYIILHFSNACLGPTFECPQISEN